MTKIGVSAFNGTTNLKEVLVYSDNLTIENGIWSEASVWSTTIPTYVTGNSFEKYRSGIFKDYTVKLLSDADNIGDVLKNFTDISDEEINAIKALLKVRDTLGAKQSGPAVRVTDKDGKEVILYSPKNVEYFKVKK